VMGLSRDLSIIAPDKAIFLKQCCPACQRAPELYGLSTFGKRSSDTYITATLSTDQSSQV